jgi:hypothetical protein
VYGIEGFENNNLWKQDGEIYRHRGEALLSYGVPANGVFAFNVQLIRGGNLFSRGRVRWMVDYRDARNYSLFELDDENLTAKEVVNGKSTDRAKVRHGLDHKQKSWSIRVDISPERAVHSIQRDGQWTTLHTMPGRDLSGGKFAFQVRGNDEIGVSDFRFTPR